jgi:iron complex transport system substrate-binding protein
MNIPPRVGDKMRDKSFKVVCALLVVVGLLADVLTCYAIQQQGQATTRAITDMLGRTVEVPARVKCVAGTSPPTTMLIYMLAPDKLLGWNFKRTKKVFQSMPPKYRELPVVGGWFGKQSGNYENFILMHPDVVFVGYTNQGGPLSTVNRIQRKFGKLPVIGVKNTVDITAYEAPIRFMGDVLGEKKKAAELISFYNKTMAYVTARVGRIPEGEKKKVYYAEGQKGLMTDPKGSPHSQLIELCGGVNIAECPLKRGRGRAEVSMEQVLLWNPDVIIAGNSTFYENVFSDPLWQNVKAVRNHEVYLIPHTPFCWFDRPPGVNRIIGILWTAQILYPEKFKDLDLAGRTKEFYSKFYHYDLSDEEFSRVVNPERGAR